jgi:haloalkane dehalogenase
MIDADETFDGTWPFKPRFSSAPGFRMHYVDEGAGEVIICLHGEPTWGYLYRNFIPALSKHYRVIVPDHMGFGKSETPKNREYALKTHVENLAALIEALDLKDITFVGQDWGGPISGGYTLRHANRVKRLCLLNTAVQRRRGTGEGRPLTPWFAWIKKHHDAGTFHEVLGNLGGNVLSVMKIIGFQNSAAVTDTWIRAYSAPFATRDECIGAIEFPLDALLRRVVPYMLEGIPYLDALKAKQATAISTMRGIIRVTSAKFGSRSRTLYSPSVPAAANT